MVAITVGECSHDLIEGLVKKTAFDLQRESALCELHPCQCIPKAKHSMST